MSRIRSALGNGRENDIADQGKVTRNCVIDLDSIREAKNNIRSKNRTDYRNITDDSAFSIYNNELVFSRKTNGMHYATHSVNPAVFSNFAGQPTTKKAASDDQNHFRGIEEDIELVGIATGSGSVYDSTLKNQTFSLAIITGGTKSITNNSRVKICNGDKLMWVPPKVDDGYENNLNQKGSNRYLAQIVVFDHDKHQLSTRKFMDYLNGKIPNDDEFGREVLYECQQFEKVLKDIQIGTFLDNLKNGDVKEFETFTKMLTIIDRFNQRIRSRIFATALSYAEPGNKVDIFLKNSYEI